MKPLLSSICIFLFSVMVTKLFAQNCEVEMETIKGNYEGDCKSGKANGKGKSVGTDTYEGEFKSGLPNGKGKYTWANGDWFEGWWQKGKKDGSGTMHFRSNTADSAVSGFWKKDEYIGLYERPYEIRSKGTATSVDVSLNKNDKRNEITISVSQAQNRLMPVTQPVLTFVNVSEGFYTERVEIKGTNKNTYTIKLVTYPFKAVFSFGTRDVEINFFTAGSYTVSILYTN